MKGIITVDIGTTSMRAILYDAAGRIVHVHQRENAPQFFSDGRVEQAPQAWAGILVESLKACADAAAETGISPAGVAVGWIHFLAFDLFVGRWEYLDSREKSISAWLAS